jgi:hypothetical protein
MVMSKQARDKDKNPNSNQVCDKLKCICVCCIPSGLIGKARVACTCVCNKCKCARSRGRDKSASNLKSKGPTTFIIVQEDPSKSACLSPKLVKKNIKSGSNKPAVAAVQQMEAVAAVQQMEAMMNCFEYSTGDASHGHLERKKEETREDKIGM